MEGVDTATERTGPGAAHTTGTTAFAESPAAVPDRSLHGGALHHYFGRGSMRHHARLAREFGEGGLRFTDKVRLAYWNAFQHDCLNTAKATAYSAIFALFPALIVLAALVTFLPYAAPLRYQLALFFNRVLPASVAPLLEHYFISSKSSPQSASVVLGTVVVSVTGAAGVLGTLMEGFRRAYHLLDEAWGEGWRGGVRRYLWSMLLVPISLIPFGAVTVLVIFGHFLLPALRHALPAGLDSTFFIVANTVRWSLAVAVTVAVIALIYRYGLPIRPRWKQVLPGAAFATVTWFLTTLGFGWYVTHLANYSKTYGSLGTGVILLLWLFLTALSVLCGAELNAELARDHARI